MTDLPEVPLPHPPGGPLDALQPVAVFLVGGGNELGPTALRIFRSMYSKDFRQIVFLSVGVLDYEVLDSGVGGHGYEDPDKPSHLRAKTRLALDPYLAVAREQGWPADCRVSISTDPVGEIDRLSTELAVAYPKAAFFVSKLVLQRLNWFHRLLRGGSSDAIRSRLEKKGFPVTVIPVVLPMMTPGR